VCQARAEMVATAIEENLSLILQTAERSRVDHPIAVALIMRAPKRGFFVEETPTGLGGKLRVRRQCLSLALLKFFAGAGHGEELLKS